MALAKRLPQFRLEVAFCCAPGRPLALVGPTGAGKTTLLRLIAGLARPDEGRVTLGGETWCDTARGRHLALQRRRVGFVFQEHELFPNLTVRENLRFAGCPPAEAARLLELFGVAHLAEDRPGRLSGGERQRVAIGQAIGRRPAVLLMDEPFSALDLAPRLTLRGKVRARVAELGIPLIHVTHDLGEALAMADQVLGLVEGRSDPAWLRGRLGLLAREAGENLARVAHWRQDNPSGEEERHD